MTLRKKFLILAPAVLAAGLAQTDAKIAREGRYWVRTEESSIEPGGAQNLRIRTQGAVSVRGRAGGPVSYSLRKLVRARNESEARQMLSANQATSTTRSGW